MTAPDRIYLQWFEMGEDCTWCSHPVSDSDVEYVRVTPPAPPADSWHAAAQWLRDNYQDHETIADLCDAMIAAAPANASAGAVPVGYLFRVLRGGKGRVDEFIAIECTPDPCDEIISKVPLYATPAAIPPAAPCPHIRSSGTGDHATNWCALNGIPPDAEASMRKHIDALDARVIEALSEPDCTFSDAKALREIVRHLRLMREPIDALRAALGEA